MRRIAIALALACLLPSVAMAQIYDSGWRRVAPGDLENLDVAGGGIRANNFLVYAEERAGQRPPQEEALRTYVFSLAATRQEAERREIFVQIIGAREDGTPTLSTAARTSFSPSGNTRMQQLRSQTPATEAEMAQTRHYFVRMIVQ